jgi:hypothetical protein
VTSRWCDQSILDARHSVDPTGRKGRRPVWNSRRGNHLGQRSYASAPTGRTYGRKRSDQIIAKTALRGGGRPDANRRAKLLICQAVRGPSWTLIHRRRTRIYPHRRGVDACFCIICPSVDSHATHCSLTTALLIKQRNGQSRRTCCFSIAALRKVFGAAWLAAPTASWRSKAAFRAAR